MTAYEKAQLATYRFSQLLARTMAMTLFPLRTAGTEHIPREGPALICSNHQSMLDPIILGATISRPLSYMARETLFRNPYFGHFIRLYDAIPIQRDRRGISGFKETVKHLRRGKMVVIFPEGTRTEDGSLGNLKPGICALLRRSRVPLIPVAVAGAFEAWPRGQRMPHPQRLAVQIATPLLLEDTADLTDEQLLDLLHDRMAWCLEQARGRIGSGSSRGGREAGS